MYNPYPQYPVYYSSPSFPAYGLRIRQNRAIGRDDRLGGNPHPWNDPNWRPSGIFGAFGKTIAPRTIRGGNRPTRKPNNSGVILLENFPLPHDDKMMDN